ncbi:MAG: ABC transporter ATP-binding protein [Desulfovibrionaceae bacterium]|nr:ABC transporter ATP-binding protein [Desulfovibrionaceae bacterium]
MALLVNQLYASYGDFQALSGISLQVEDHQIVALVGSNAAGKSTLINCISGTHRQKHGEITFNGERIDNVPANKIVEKGLIQTPEGRRVFPFMSVQENIEMGAYLPGPRTNRVANMEKIYQLLPILYERRKQMAGSLSGGEQQMLAIGRALMSEPKLLMLDEPTLGLAPIIVDKVFDLILDIRKQGTTVLLVEQNVQHALEIADYAYVVGNGSLLMEGPGKKLMLDDELVKAYMGI